MGRGEAGVLEARGGPVGKAARGRVRRARLTGVTSEACAPHTQGERCAPDSSPGDAAAAPGTAPGRRCSRQQWRLHPEPHAVQGPAWKASVNKHGQGRGGGRWAQDTAGEFLKQRHREGVFFLPAAAATTMKRAASTWRGRGRAGAERCCQESRTHGSSCVSCPARP